MNMPRISQSGATWTARCTQDGAADDLFVDDGAPAVLTSTQQPSAHTDGRHSAPQPARDRVVSALAGNEQDCVVLLSQLPRESWSAQDTAVTPMSTCVRHDGLVTECVPDTSCLWHGAARLVHTTGDDCAGPRHGVLSLPCSSCRIVVPFVPLASSGACRSNAGRPGCAAVCAAAEEGAAAAHVAQGRRLADGAAWLRAASDEDEEEEDGESEAAAQLGGGARLHGRGGSPPRRGCDVVAEEPEEEDVMQGLACQSEAALTCTRRLSLRFLLQSCRLPHGVHQRLCRLFCAHVEQVLCSAVLPCATDHHVCAGRHALPEAAPWAASGVMQFWFAAFAHTAAIHDEVVRAASALHDKLCHEHVELPCRAQSAVARSGHDAVLHWPRWVPPQTLSILILQALQRAALVLVREMAITLHQVSRSGGAAPHSQRGGKERPHADAPESGEADYHAFCQLCDSLFGAAMQRRLLRVVQRALPFAVSVSALLLQDATSPNSRPTAAPDVARWVYPACLQRTASASTAAASHEDVVAAAAAGHGASRKHARDAVWTPGVSAGAESVLPRCEAAPSLLGLVYGLASDLLTTLFPALEARLQAWMCTCGPAPLLRAWAARADTCHAGAEEREAGRLVALRRSLLSFLHAMRWWADWHEQGATRYAAAAHAAPTPTVLLPAECPACPVVARVAPAPVWSLAATSNYVALNALRWLLEGGPALPPCPRSARTSLLPTAASTDGYTLCNKNNHSGNSGSTTFAMWDEEVAVQGLASLLELLPCLCRHYLLRHEVQGVLLRSYANLCVRPTTAALLPRGETGAAEPRPCRRAVALRCLVVAIGWCVFSGPHEHLCEELGVMGRCGLRRAHNDAREEDEEEEGGGKNRNAEEHTCTTRQTGLSAGAVRAVWARLRLERCWRDWLLPLCQALHTSQTGSAAGTNAAHVLCVAAELAQEALHTLRLLRHRLHHQHMMQTRDAHAGEATSAQRGAHGVATDAAHECERDVTDTRSVALSSLSASTRTTTTAMTNTEGVATAGALGGCRAVPVASTVRVRDLRCLRTGVMCLLSVLQAAVNALASAAAAAAMTRTASDDEGTNTAGVARTMAPGCDAAHGELDAECHAVLQSCSSYAACIAVPITVRVDDLGPSFFSSSSSSDDDEDAEGAQREMRGGSSEAGSDSVTLSSSVYDESYSSASTTSAAAHVTRQATLRGRAAQRAHRRRPRSDSPRSDTVSSSTTMTATPSPHATQQLRFPSPVVLGGL